MNSVIAPPANAAPKTPRPTLADAFDVRRNAIAFLRPALSALVILGHAWELGGFGHDPLQVRAGVPFGVFAVHAFFVIGGFLVAGSFENSTSWRRYIANRCLRIFPGYWFCLFVSATVLLPIAAAIAKHAGGLGTGVTLPALARYVCANFLLRIYAPNVGALFASHPASGIINGSFWSLFPEMFCYVLLAVAGVAGLLRAGQRGLLAAVAIAAWGLYAATPRIIAALAGSAWGPKIWYLLQIDSLLTYFCAGALCWVFRDVLPFSRLVRYGAVVATLVVLAVGAYRWLGPITLPLAILALATDLPWRNFDRYGDFSYGLYLYHYPLQQMLYSLHIGASPGGLFLASFLFTLPLAWLSWTLIERPALAWKRITLHRAPA